MIKKINAEQLRIGMFVCGIDSNWENSTLFKNQSIITSELEIKKLRSVSEFFFIDTDRCSDSLNNPYNSFEKVNSVCPEYLLCLQEMSCLIDDLRSSKSLSYDNAKLIAHLLIKFVTKGINSAISCCSLDLKSDSNEFARKSVNVAIYSIALGWVIGLPNDDLIALALGSLLHDIGIIFIPEDILTKIQPLNAKERLILEKHTFYGLKLLGKSDDVPVLVKKIVYQHHERIDGKGYPNQLSGDEIHILVRLVNIISIFVALTRERGYAEKLSPETALKLIYLTNNSELERTLVQKFITLLGIYPEGVIVELSTGEIAVVIAVNKENRLSPILRLLTDERKNLLDLSHQNNIDCEFGNGVNIIRILDDDESLVQCFGLLLQFENTAMSAQGTSDY